MVEIEAKRDWNELKQIQDFLTANLPKDTV